MGKWVDASVIFGVAFINAIVGYLQEATAEKAIEALAKMVLTDPQLLNLKIRVRTQVTKAGGEFKRCGYFLLSFPPSLDGSSLEFFCLEVFSLDCSDCF